MSPHDRDRLNRRTLLKGAAGFGAAAALLGGAGLSPARAKDAASLQFWDMVWGPPEYIDTGKKLVAQFGAATPDVKVTYQSTPWTNWYQTFTTAIGSGTAPDVSTGAAYQSVQFYDQGAVAALDGFIDQLKASGTLADFLPGTVDVLRYDNHYVALPWAIDIRIPYYRKDLFQESGVEPPTTWDELATAAKRLTKGGRSGVVVPGADTGGTHYLYTLILNNGGGLFTKDRKPNLMFDRNVEALEFFSRLVKDGVVNPASTGYVGDDAIKAFGQGNSAIIINNPGFEKRFPALQDKIGILPPLAAPHGDKGTIFWVNNVMLYKQSAHPDAAQTFLKWWSDNNGPLWTEGHCTQLPVRQSLAKQPYFANNANSSYILQHWVPIAKTTATFATGIFPQLNAVEGEGLMQTLVQDLLQGKDVKASMQKADAQMKSLFK